MLPGALVALTALGAGDAKAEAYYCLDNTSFGWAGEKPAPIDSAVTEFWIDTTSGEWTERIVGGRAGTTGGGRFVVIHDGMGYRSDWVGVEWELGESIRLRTKEAPHIYVRVRREMIVETGACIVDDGTRTYLDGVVKE